jgi:prostaglandin-H2 D-isomerase / glutathione transferase
VANLKGLNPEYKEKDAPPYYELLGQYYAEREGPYLLGDTVSYADFAVYVSLDNDIRTGTLPVRFIVLKRVIANLTRDT